MRYGKYVEAEVEKARQEVREAARGNKRGVDPEKVRAAAELRFNELVLGIRRRTLTVWSLRHNCPLEITEQLEGEQGQERWVRIAEQLKPGEGRGPGIPTNAG